MVASGDRQFHKPRLQRLPVVDVCGPSEACDFRRVVVFLLHVIELRLRSSHILPLARHWPLLLACHHPTRWIALLRKG